MRYTPRQYGQALYELVEETGHSGSQEIVKRFSNFLHKRGDLRLMPRIAEAFEKYSRKMEDKIRVEIRGVEKPAIPHEIRSRSEVVFLEDKDALGGISVKIRDVLVDNTIRARINNLKRILQ